MKTRQEVIDYSMSLGDCWLDAPFPGADWQLVRLKKNSRTFVFVYEYHGRLQINVKCDPAMTAFWREGFEGVIPAYHMNKTHWNSVILDGSVPRDAVEQMIADSYDLINK